VEKDFAVVEDSRAKQGINSASVKKTLSQVTTDIDLIFEEMDIIRGDEAVKKRRKALIARLRVVSDRVDAILLLPDLCG
jgi:hypothetical protein